MEIKSLHILRLERALFFIIYNQSFPPPPPKKTNCNPPSKKQNRNPPLTDWYILAPRSNQLG